MSNTECPADTIGRALASATATLRSAGLSSARLDAELLLGHLLDKTRTQLVIDRDEPLSSETADALTVLTERRIAGKPIAYLIGQREFMGHRFSVGPGVLVPRPETELLVELALAMVERSWPTGPVRVLDLCTGSGAIALSLALVSDERIEITGSDISPDALVYAHTNRAHLGLTERVALVEGDLLQWTDGPWDLIVSNPPYLRPDQIDDNLEIAAEPRLALDGGRGGTELIERILEQAVGKVSARFGMLIELDPDHALNVQMLARERFPDAEINIIDDLTGRQRFLSIERKSGTGAYPST